VDLLAEKRIAAAYAGHDASQWSPRDVLVQMIRDIDAGVVVPASLVVAWTSEVPGGGVTGGYLVSARTVYESTFMVEKLKQDMWADGIA
jgi:hypothetical protein